MRGRPTPLAISSSPPREGPLSHSVSPPLLRLCPPLPALPLRPSPLTPPTPAGGCVGRLAALLCAFLFFSAVTAQNGGGGYGWNAYDDYEPPRYVPPPRHCFEDYAVACYDIRSFGAPEEPIWYDLSPNGNHLTVEPSMVGGTPRGVLRAGEQFPFPGVFFQGNPYASSSSDFLFVSEYVTLTSSEGGLPLMAASRQDYSPPIGRSFTFAAWIINIPANAPLGWNVNLNRAPLMSMGGPGAGPDAAQGNLYISRFVDNDGTNTSACNYTDNSVSMDWGFPWLSLIHI